jgi:hypothetical protein
MGPSLEGGRADFLGYELPMLVGLIPLRVLVSKVLRTSVCVIWHLRRGSLVAYSSSNTNALVHYQFWLAIPVSSLAARFCWFVQNICRSAYRTIGDRFVHFARLVHLAELLPLQLRPMSLTRTSRPTTTSLN